MPVCTPSDLIPSEPMHDAHIPFTTQLYDNRISAEIPFRIAVRVQCAPLVCFKKLMMKGQDISRSVPFMEGWRATCTGGIPQPILSRLNAEGT